MNQETHTKALLIQKVLKEKRNAIQQREELEKDLKKHPGQGEISSRNTWVLVKDESIKFVLHLELHQLEQEIKALEKEFTDL